MHVSRKIFARKVGMVLKTSARNDKGGVREKVEFEPFRMGGARRQVCVE